MSHKIAVIGFGVEGQSAARYWSGLGGQITIRDLNRDLKIPHRMHGRLGPDYLDDLDQFDLVVRSPGTKPWEIFEANPGLNPINVTSITNEFLRLCPAPVIGVTGTKGKGTTVSLVAAILRAAGKSVHVGGNIGVPALDFLNDDKPTDHVVLELSSYQLIDAGYSPQTAVMLMIAPDHQEWHRSMEEYIAAKARIFRQQKTDDVAVYNACNLASWRAGIGAPSRDTPYNAVNCVRVESDTIFCYDQEVCDVDQIGLIGRHNWDNVCAAVAATWPIVGDMAPIRQAISEFKGLEHRLELAGEADGVKYYDDSFSTNPETSIAAIQAFAKSKVIILGGSDKRADYARLAEAVVTHHVRAVIAIGDTGPAIAKALRHQGFEHIIEGEKTMPSIVHQAAKAAQPGDTVLLSPGCASFGLFTNYKERGYQFKAAVQQLSA